MGNKNDKKERINVVYSTNPNYQYEYNQEKEQEKGQHHQIQIPVGLQVLEKGHLGRFIVTQGRIPPSSGRFPR